MKDISNKEGEETMNLKKVLLFTAPVALAGFMLLGEVAGLNQVIAKTLAQKGDFITRTEIANYTQADFDDESGYYIYKGHSESPDGEYVICYFDVYEKIYIQVNDDSDDKITPTVDPEAETAKKREEAALEVQKAAEKKTIDFQEEIRKSVEKAINLSMKNVEEHKMDNSVASEVPSVLIKTDYFTCFTKDMMDLLAANPDMNYEIHYRYKGKRYVVVIPAGTDYSKLQDSNGYYGFRYLDSIFGGYEEGTK